MVVKRIISFILVFCIVLGVFTACETKKDDADDNVEEEIVISDKKKILGTWFNELGDYIEFRENGECKIGNSSESHDVKYEINTKDKHLKIFGSEEEIFTTYSYKVNDKKIQFTLVEENGVGISDGEVLVYYKEKPQQDNKDQIPLPLKDGVLTVGVTSFYPATYRDDNGNWVGFDTELAVKFAEYMNVDIELVEILWEAVPTKLENGSIDCVWNFMVATDERRIKFDLSDSYAYNNAVLVMRSDRINEYSDSYNNNFKYVLLKDTLAHILFETKNYNYIIDDSFENCLSLLSTGQADVLGVDEICIDIFEKNGTDFSSYAIVDSIEREEYVVALKKGSDMTKYINKFLKQCKADGTLEHLSEKYGVSVNV